MRPKRKCRRRSKAFCRIAPTGDARPERHPITDAGLKSLAGLKVLQELYLNDTAVTDAGLALLKELTNLEILALQKTKVTGAGLKT